MRFENKTVVIASSGGSLGIAIEKKMREEGAKTVLLTKKEEELKSLPEETLGLFIPDFTDEAKVEEAFKKTKGTFGSVDVIVTAIFEKAPEKAWDEITSEEAHQVVHGILTGARTVIKYFLPVMVEKEQGRVVILMPVSGRTNVPGMPWTEALAYAGLGGIIRNGATVFGKNSVTFNGVAVGPVEGMDLPAYIDNEVKGVWGRKASADDAAYAVMYLADEEGAWNTGEIIDLNGGYFAI